jgi:hypothetical protein
MRNRSSFNHAPVWRGQPAADDIVIAFYVSILAPVWMEAYC